MSSNPTVIQQTCKYCTFNLQAGRRHRVKRHLETSFKKSHNLGRTPRSKFLRWIRPVTDPTLRVYATVQTHGSAVGARYGSKSRTSPKVFDRLNRNAVQVGEPKWSRVAHFVQKFRSRKECLQRTESTFLSPARPYMYMACEISDTVVANMRP